VVPTLLGNFIYQNYRQALEKLETNSNNLTILAAKLGTTSEDYELYLQSEQEYLKNLRVEPAEVVQAASYVDHLVKLYRLQ
jgi:hypothetical protein